MDMTEEFEKWWHGDDTSRHPTNRYEGAMRWAYEGWVRGATAEREACADICEAYYDTLHAPWPPAHEEPTHEPPRLDEHTYRHGGE